MTHKHRWLKRTATAVALGLAVTATALAVRPGPIRVQIGTIVRGPLVVTVEGSGRSRMANKQTLYSPVAGTLTKIALQSGDMVHEGQVLAEVLPGMPQPLDPRSHAEAIARLGAARVAITEAEHNVERAELGLKLAADEAERDRKLFASQAIASITLQNAEMDQKAKQAEVDLARATAERVRLESAEIAATLRAPSKLHTTPKDVVAVRAPRDGVVLRVQNENAGPVSMGSPLLDWGDPSDMEFVVDLPTQSATKVATGARVRLDNIGNGVQLTGAVKRVEPAAFTKVTALGVEEQRVNVIVVPAADSANWSVIGDGFAADAHIEIYRNEQALKAPSAAVFRHASGYSLFRVVDGHARLTTVDVGERNAEAIELIRPLDVSAPVIVHPSDKVVNGSAVSPE